MLPKFHLLLFSLLLVLLSTKGSSEVSPDTLWNQTDNQGRKQGHWKKSYPNGELMYRGFFRDDRPVGLMERFYDDGKLRAVLDYKGKTGTTYAIMYFRN
ncbi:MAG: hypothetical protein KAT15_18535 [Bacteroidales bacterium]|nr:hypothetical protein [Bacteroidales bacterium]